MAFLLSERYRLEIHWDRAEKKENVVYFSGAYFSGPALKMAEKMNDEDMIKLDFCSQYTIIVRNVYVATFKWKGLSYKDHKVYFNQASLTYEGDTDLAPSLKNDDYIVIDTKNHENEKHYYNMFYTSFTVDKDHNVYTFRR